MWFLWLGLGLTLVVVAGLYVRRRLVAAVAALGLGRRGQAAVRWLVPWLLFGYPVIVFATVAVSLVLGRGRMSGFEGPVATWGLVLPFFLAVLVVVQALPYLLVIEAVHQVRRRWWAAPTAMTRARALAVLAPLVGFAIYTPARIVWERGDLRWRHHLVQARGDAGAERPPPFRIAFIADIQQDAHTDAAEVAAIVARLDATHPDLVLAGGDWINLGPDHIAAAARSAGQLRSRLGTFSVVGDHEHFAYTDQRRSVDAVAQAMRAQGVELVRDEVRRFTHHGRSIAVGFLTNSYPAPATPATVERLVAALADADVAILVTHQLDRAIAAVARDRVDLILAGHTHGGQVNPVVGLWHVPLARLETPYVDGRFQLGRTTIIVTAGVGYSLVPFRYASPGSIETIDVGW
ncbi:MAG: metallophosphoesterase [Kofleriaceae bacterium]